MSLQVTIDGKYEAIIRTQIATGQASSPEELVARALMVYVASGPGRFSLGSSQKSPSEAATDILRLREEIDLSGLKVRGLAHEGHKY